MEQLQLFISFAQCPPPKKTTKKPHTVPEYDQNNQEGSLICASQSFQSAVLPI